MEKIGRNDPCPCGSKKKYKRCHGAPTPEVVPDSRPQSQPPQAQLRVGQIGIPGQIIHLIVANQFRDPADPRNIGSPGGVPGDYRVTFILSRPGFSIEPETQISFVGPLRGDSHLGITRPAMVSPENIDADRIRIQAVSPDGQFTFVGLPNEGGLLGKLESNPFRANNFNDAERKAYRALVPSLSHWSVQLDIPLNIYKVESTEERTQNRQTSVTTAYLQAPWAVTPTSNLDPEFLACASFYRESLNSNSRPYSYLCLFKIIEGIRNRRTRLQRKAKRLGASVVLPVEVVPATPDSFVPWLNAIFQIRPPWDAMALSMIFRSEAIGKPFEEVFEKFLNPLRDKIAHALTLGSKELMLPADELVHNQEIGNWLPLTKCLVRRMLKNEFPTQFLSFLKEDGTISP
jgi:methylamine utilization protein MauJ/SEC-C motif-containing protein